MTPAPGGTQTQALESLERAVNYSCWLADLLDPWLGTDVVEIGAGNGSMSRHWLRPGRRVTITEPDAQRVALLARRFGTTSGVRVERRSLPSLDTASYTSAVAVNVIEHLRDDGDAVRSMARLVRPGGYVALLVPAFPLAMSRFDREIGHYRRYRTRGVRALLVAAGLVPVQVEYVNSLGLVGWTVVVKGLRRSPSDGALLTLFDRHVVPTLRRIEHRHPPPFGQSVIGVGRVPEDGV
jgi:SAM-dependent methyltransferase